MKQLVSRVRNRIAYRRTIAELSALPREVRDDLHLDTGRIAHLAHEAVYGA